LADRHDARTGQYGRYVLPLSPTRAPDPEEYVFTEVDPPFNHVTRVSATKVQERVERKYIQSDHTRLVLPDKRKRQVIIVGGGHNGLIAAAYLAKHVCSVV
jgi:hypothetical protein